MQLVRPIGSFLIHTAYITSSRELYHHELSHNRNLIERSQRFVTLSKLPSSSSVSMEDIVDSDLPSILSVRLQTASTDKNKSIERNNKSDADFNDHGNVDAKVDTDVNNYVEHHLRTNANLDTDVGDQTYSNTDANPKVGANEYSKSSQHSDKRSSETDPEYVDPFNHGKVPTVQSGVPGLPRIVDKLSSEEAMGSKRSDSNSSFGSIGNSDGLSSISSTSSNTTDLVRSHTSSNTSTSRDASSTTNSRTDPRRDSTDSFRNNTTRVSGRTRDGISDSKQMSNRTSSYKYDDLLDPVRYDDYRRLQRECDRLKQQLRRKESNFDKDNYRIKKEKVYEPIEVRVGLRIQESDLSTKCKFFKKKAAKGYPLIFMIKTDGEPEDYQLAAEGIFNKAKVFLSDVCTTTGKMAVSKENISMYFKPINNPRKSDNSSNRRRDDKRSQSREYDDHLYYDKRSEHTQVPLPYSSFPQSSLHSSRNSSQNVPGGYNSQDSQDTWDLNSKRLQSMDYGTSHFNNQQGSQYYSQSQVNPNDTYSNTTTNINSSNNIRDVSNTNSSSQPNTNFGDFNTNSDNMSNATTGISNSNYTNYNTNTNMDNINYYGSNTSGQTHPNDHYLNPYSSPNPYLQLTGYQGYGNMNMGYPNNSNNMGVDYDYYMGSNANNTNSNMASNSNTSNNNMDYYNYQYNPNHGYQNDSSINRDNYYGENNYNPGYYGPGSFQQNTNMMNQSGYLGGSDMGTTSSTVGGIIGNANTTNLSNSRSNTVNTISSRDSSNNSRTDPRRDNIRDISSVSSGNTSRRDSRSEMYGQGPQSRTRDTDSRWIVKNKPESAQSHYTQMETQRPSPNQSTNSRHSGYEPSPVGDGSSSKWKVLNKKVM